MYTTYTNSIGSVVIGYGMNKLKLCLKSHNSALFYTVQYSVLTLTVSLFSV